jgi:uncharacterized protein
MDITVIKHNFKDQEVWRYTGQILRRDPRFVLLEARFNRPSLYFNGVWFNEGDRFVELYFTDRWYNIFEVHHRKTNALKCWYCNLSRPSVIEGSSLVYIDMALDLMVFPDGRQLLLDEDEYKAINPSIEIQQQIQSAVLELRKIFNQPVAMRLEQLDIDKIEHLC